MLWRSSVTRWTRAVLRSAGFLRAMSLMVILDRIGLSVYPRSRRLGRTFRFASFVPQRDENRGKSAILKRTFRGRNKNCGCAHEVAGDNQQQRMPGGPYRYTFGGDVASAF